MSMRRITRERKLSEEEAAKYDAVRRQVAGELPELVARHHQRAAADDLLGEVLAKLQAEREKRGLSLADVTELTGMDRSALSKLESGQRPNPTIDTLARYAQALGKRLVLALADE
jgi:DNA-binding XRE family transcriptional regulator